MSNYFKQDAAGNRYAGLHVLLEMWNTDTSQLTDPWFVENALTNAAYAASANIVHKNFYSFGTGLSGVILLSESHISIHTWPEEFYAAIDIFMCGNCDPLLSVQSIKSQFNGAFNFTCIQRGHPENRAF